MTKKHRWQIALAVAMCLGYTGVAQAATHPATHPVRTYAQRGVKHHIHSVKGHEHLHTLRYHSVKQIHGLSRHHPTLPAVADDYTALTPTALQLMHLSPVEFAGVGAAPQPVSDYVYHFQSFPETGKSSVTSPEFVDQSLVLVKTGLPAAGVHEEAPVKVAAPVDALSVTSTPEQSHLRLALEMLASQAYHWARHPLQALESNGDAASGPQAAEQLANDIAQQASQYAEGGSDTASTGDSWLSPRAMVVSALKFIGAPYRWGGMSPSGFDCSGFVKYILAKFDIRVPRTSYAQAADLRKVSRENLKPGDLVFFDTMHRPFSHVGIYIGHQRFVSAQTPRTGVQVGSLNDPYWAAHYDGARSLPGTHDS
ncbi:NlpC/P60 family protein [Acidithiobacillus montserratensis]|uniref:NlpC/P60 family protein n=1 Tax=Acidithiobacillus montserratensis TaxID=2729135 RepID=A0ACD5HIB5_9PROT|nr:C40 family peptidase [Acidithiobacillus montserratensis]MBN2679807.1 C40 family peptidase [Acidithiobacillaceae bacterium]MBU2748122.1 hydrolase Nlp/P60 [Acidithiobacillus montserratensis]